MYLPDRWVDNTQPGMLFIFTIFWYKLVQMKFEKLQIPLRIFYAKSIEIQFSNEATTTSAAHCFHDIGHTLKQKQQYSEKGLSYLGA
jgi:hypothetical protein